MPSPFPGMDPYLEQQWTNLHTTLITYIRDWINPRLPRNYIAKMEEAIAVESDEGDRWAYVPDVFVAPDPDALYDPQDEGGDGGGVAVAEPVAVAKPIKIKMVTDEWMQKYITITDARGSRLITVIELLSPSNKRGGGMREYRKKRQDILWGGANLVEIDLCRGGDWERLLWPDTLPPEAEATYRIITHRRHGSGSLEIFPIHLDQRLPAIPIPLRENDEDVVLDLQPLLDRAYDNGRFGRSLDYTARLEPPLEGEEAAWAAGVLEREQLLHHV